jgi:hypothetical protein
MSTRLFGAALLVGLACALPAAAQQKVTLKFHRSKQSEVSLIEKTENSDNKSSVVGKDDKVVNAIEDKKTVSNITFRETIVEKAADAKKATRLKREYLKAEETVNGTKVALPYAGKTVLIEKKGDKYHFQIEGGAELTAKDAEKLDSEFNKKGSADSEEFFTALGEGKTVAVGETWKIDLKVLEKLFGQETQFILDPASKATVKLVRAYKKDGMQFGVLKVEIMVLLKGIKEKGKDIAMEPGSKFNLNLDIDTTIDGSRDLATLTIKGGANFAIRIPDNPDLRYVVVTSGDSTEHHKAPGK